MAHIQKREGKAKQYIVRYPTPSGQERSKSFKRKADAERFSNQVEVGGPPV